MYDYHVWANRQMIQHLKQLPDKVQKKSSRLNTLNMVAMSSSWPISFTMSSITEPTIALIALVQKNESLHQVRHKKQHHK